MLIKVQSIALTILWIKFLGVMFKITKESFSVLGQSFNINKNDRENLADSRIESYW